MNKTLYRPIQRGDIQDITALHRLMPHRAWSAEEFESLLSKGARGMIVHRGDCLLGFVLYRTTTPQDTEILTLIVHPDYRRQRVAHDLLKRLEKQLGYDKHRLILDVASTNETAIALYKKQGFQHIHTRKNYYRHRTNGTATDAWVMEKKLVAPKVDFDFFDNTPPPNKQCDAPGCGVYDSLFPAPKSRDSDRRRASSYYWFCEHHVREYNARWDYYKDMSAEEIEQSLHDDVTWNRPTWSFGKTKQAEEAVREKVHAFQHGTTAKQSSFRATARMTERLREERRTYHDDPVINQEINEALAQLNITEAPVPFVQIKSVYRDLAKRYHPDRCTEAGGEESLKRINQAYSVLKMHQNLFD